ncbi:MAG: DUF2306 domain-containing protein [Gemmatimonadetes bacterium]|nr:DUF2306 domain-containing protein [Gemmatimonadota bacterium]
MTTTGGFHLAFSLIAIAAGAVVLLLPKGTRWHRTWGHGYVWSMVGVIVTSMAMYDLTGRVTPFHFAALVATVTVAGGMWTVLRRRPRGAWIEAHATWMAWSYVGLTAALVAESLTRFVMPVAADRLTTGALWPAFWALVMFGTFGAVAVGARLIRTRLPASIQRAPGAIRRERQELA